VKQPGTAVFPENAAIDLFKQTKSMISPITIGALSSMA
jgi:hypothetical protein